MRVLSGGHWRDGFLDYYRGPTDYRIRVIAMRNVERLDDLYFVRPKSARLILNYLMEIGPREVLRKIVSRSHERLRNDKYLSVGIGRVLEAPEEEGALSSGTVVTFIAPAHPACVERIVLPRTLLAVIDEANLRTVPGGAVLHRPVGAGNGSPPAEAMRGWSPYSGQEPPELPASVWSRIARIAGEEHGLPAELLQVGAGSPVRCSREAKSSPAAVGRRTILFGYGNYAKTVVLPNVAPHLRVERIHEVDPTQIPAGPSAVTWDTSPHLPRGDGEYAAVLIAGYHHTHAPLAVEAVKRGAAAVVEKPIATDREQLDALVRALEASEGRLFSCYQKRYHPFNELARTDLGLRPEDPVSYHCIVYEVPLPALHWYRWPNSRSRLVSNGCHWIDHFLYLNDYSEPVDLDLVVAADGTINCSALLQNGAFFTMVLTDQGSPRIGVQDYVELRAKGVTVRVTNSTLYSSERHDRVIRGRRMNKMIAYRLMYQQIGGRIAAGEPGDTMHSLRVSAGMILALEELLQNSSGTR